MPKQIDEKKTRRGNGEATYRTKVINGTEYIEGRIFINGRQRSVYAKTPKACRDRIDELKFKKGYKRKASNVTLKKWLDTWLDEIQIAKKQTTYENYKTVVEKHLKPTLGAELLENITREDVQGLIKKKAKKLSPRTVRLISFVLGAAMKAAVLDRIIEYNPVHDLSLPKIEKPEYKIITKDAFNKVLEVDTTNDALATAAKFVLTTGLRRGEALGLKWSEVDLQSRTITIKKSLVSTQTGAQLTTTKNKQSVRVLPLYQITVDILKKWKKEQLAQKKDYGKGYTNSGFVFTTLNGTNFSPDSMRLGLARLLKAAKVPKVKVHELRHSYATMLLERGVSLKVVQELLGHVNIQITSDTYSHVTMGLKKQAIAETEGFFDTSNKE